MNFSYKTILPHLIVILGFVVVALAYFSPVLKGEQIYQSDIVQYTGMAKQQKDFRQSTGEETYWTNSAFGGMPTYQLGAQYPHNYIKKLDHTLRFLPRPADYLFLYLISFYILMLVLKVDYRLAVIGALAFGFSTYLIIILGVGHNAKAHAIAYMPLVLAGIILCFQKKYFVGFLLTAVALGLELSANHFQMTFYLMLLVLVLGIVYLIEAIQKKMLPHFFKTVGILLIAVIIAVGLNATNIMATQEYVKESTRSKSELTINPDGSLKEASNGLDKNYITEYSYGIVETFNLFIPRFMGGGSYEDVGKDSETYDAFRKLGATPVQALQEAKRAPTYWGDQPIVEAPAYIGAVVLFLFVFALFLVKGRLKRWVVATSILALLLSYGKNLGFLTDLFIDYFPMYNKFRAVSSIQVLIELSVPILAIFGLSRILNDFEQEEDKLSALKYTSLILGGLGVLFFLFKGSLFDFAGANDDAYVQAYGPDFIKAVKEDRMSLFSADTLRSLLLVVTSAAAIWLFLKRKLSETALIIAFGVLILIDLVGVDRRYVNNDDFTSAIQVQKPFQMTPADREILNDTSYYRVFDMTSASTRASYYHNSLNGYHAAKLRRYNELFDFHIQRNNIQVLNMLNTKYIIGQDEGGQVVPFGNPEANGPAWFVQELITVNSADEEIRMLDSLDTKNQAVILKNLNFSKDIPSTFERDSLASISLVDHKPNYLKYESNNSADGLAVFSEVYYEKGWDAYIDGQAIDHFRVNYVLRALEVPKGTHTIEFKFEPQVVKTGSTIALASSLITALLILSGLYFEYKKK
ncbi:MAG: YfhO family protein [Flavobacteriaceae bacterium]|nr:YfhO family protein [Flavobacteriaceae bacterium]